MHPLDDAMRELDNMSKVARQHIRIVTCSPPDGSSAVSVYLTKYSNPAGLEGIGI